MVAKIKETNVAPSILLSKYAFLHHLFEFIYYHKQFMESGGNMFRCLKQIL